MTDFDPTKGGDKSGEHLSAASEELARALGNVVHIQGIIAELDAQDIANNGAITDLQKQLDAAIERRRHIGRETDELNMQRYNAVGDTVKKLAEVFDTYDMSVADAIELLKSTTAQLDPAVLSNVTKQAVMWHDSWVNAINPYDEEELLRKDAELRDVPEGEFIGLLKDEEIWVGKPQGAPRLKMVADTYRTSQPFPYKVQVEMRLAEKEDSEQQEDSFVGDIIIGADAIVAEALKGKRHDYRTSRGAPFEPEVLLRTYKNDQHGLRRVAELGLDEKISDERKAQVRRAIAQSHAGFRSSVGLAARSIYAIPDNRALYASLLGSVYFDKNDYRKTTDLIDTIYGDGASEDRVKLAAYTQVLARIFEEDGKLAGNVEVTPIDMRHAMYLLTRDKSN